MVVARFVILPYLLFAALGGVGVASSAQPPESQLEDGVASPQKLVQSADDDAGGDDNEIADGDFDDDVLPSSTPAIAPAAPAAERPLIATPLAPKTTARDPLYRPPRLASA
ncbi:MAG: hypothetical protein ACXVDD_14535 [Polyangia bacterium]